MSTIKIKIKEPTSYLQKDIIEKQVVSQTYQDNLRIALEYIAEHPNYSPGAPYIDLSVWAPPERF